MIYIVILLSIIIFSLFYQSESFNNFSNHIYATRPPHFIAKNYDPENLNPIKILKSNFLPHPMEGYQNSGKLETFTNPLDYLFKNDNKIELESGFSKMAGDEIDTKTAIFIDNQFNEMKDIKYSPMTENEIYSREIVKQIGNKNVPIINAQMQSISNLNLDKTDFEVKTKQYKFFKTQDCADGYNFTGAHFSNSNGLQCNGDENIYQPAKVVARIDKGQIVGIKVIDGGSGYVNPSVQIISNDKTGTGAIAKITAMGDNNSIKYIEIIDSGIGYIEIPNVNIVNSVENNSCYLCEK